jgi:DNA uptake protein ComE-like DNA-binding protein
MHPRLISITFIASALACFAPTSIAQQDKDKAMADARFASALGQDSKASSAAPKSVAKVKLIDLNNASKEELKSLPGVGDEVAGKIIAKRPYVSKADLVSKGVMLGGPYASVRALVTVEPSRNSPVKVGKQ